MKRLAVAVLCLCLAFAAGLAVGRLTPRPAPVTRPAAESPIVPAPTDGACKRELVSAKTQLAICLAFRASPESSAPIAPPTPTAAPPEWDDLTKELVRTHTKNRETVMVKPPPGERGLRIYRPGEWPPPDGPPIGARIVTRHVDGGTELIAADGGVRLVPAPPCPNDSEEDGVPWNPCPKDTTDAGASP